MPIGCNSLGHSAVFRVKWLSPKWHFVYLGIRRWMPTEYWHSPLCLVVHKQLCSCLQDLSLLSLKQTNKHIIRGGSRDFLEGGWFSKKLRKFCRFFLGRSNWFSELSQSTTKTLFWPKRLRRRRNFEKTGHESVFRHILEKFDQKIAFFLRALPPLKLVYMAPKAPLEKF